ncbi:MAG: hypothetical protein L0H93_10500, partial [Nocardioides sp.]|nr:hypothetical protein [Nocardioides sp.]
VAQVGQVLASWQHSSKTGRQGDQDRPDEETSSPSGQGPVQLGDASTLERLADVALGEWRQRRVS